jgi:nucleotide-binding universal stress UspA family protein
MKTVEVGTRIAVKNILFATDFSSCSTAALSYATSFARRFGAMLHVAHVLPSDPNLAFMPPETWPLAMEEEEKWARERTEELEPQLQGVPHEVLTPKGEVRNILARIVREKEIDLIVLGTHGRTGVRKLFMGSVAEAVFRGSPCAVLTVGPIVSPAPNGEIRFQNILFATDFSDDSLAALPYAISLAEVDQARVAILHVVGQPAAGVRHPEELKHALTQRLQKLAQAQDYPWCRAEYLVEFTPLFEPVGERVLQIARDRGADLIVMGVRREHGTGAVVTHLTSTTAQHIVAHAECPVLTVRG